MTDALATLATLAALDERTFRARFEEIAPQLDARAAWRIAADAIDRFGDGDAGGQTRYLVRSVALARWAREVGLEAMSEVIAAISEHPEIGLDALIAMTDDPELDRARVLADLKPYWKHGAVLRVPVLAAQALQALGATPEAAPLPREIVKAWDQARLTEASIVSMLVAHGLIARDAALPSSRSFVRLVGRSLVVDVLARAGVAATFDAESGMAPVPYEALFADTLRPLLRSPATMEVRATALPGDVFRYEISLCAGAVTVKDTFTDGSDYYDVERLVQMMNELFAQQREPSRVHAMRTGDQTALLLCAPPKIARALAKETGLAMERRAAT